MKKKSKVNPINKFKKIIYELRKDKEELTEALRQTRANLDGFKQNHIMITKKNESLEKDKHDYESIFICNKKRNEEEVIRLNDRILYLKGIITTILEKL